MGLLRQSNSPYGAAMTNNFGPPDMGGGGGDMGIPSFGLPSLSDILDIGQKAKNLFSDPNKFIKRQQGHQVLLDFITLLQGEAERRRANIQGVKDAERKAPMRAAMAASLMSGGLEGFGSQFSLLRANARPRSFLTTDEAGNQAASVEGPGGPPASPEQLAELDNFLEPSKFVELREQGRKAAAAQSPESLFTPTESAIPQGGLPNNMQFGVNKSGDAARQREIIGQASSTGLTPEQEAQYLPGRAMGGPVRAGQPYVVGERGPEVVVPQQNGQVIPNDPEDHNRKQLKKVFQILSERGVGI